MNRRLPAGATALGAGHGDRAAHTPSIPAAAFVPSVDQRLDQLLPRSDVPQVV